nr:unnamed protein product [Spirometra erinaceieuropaei]
MPFGLRNATQTFQRFIDQVLRGLDFVYAYIDDLLVASSDAAEHEIHLRQLDSYGVIINAAKCILGPTMYNELVPAICSARIPILAVAGHSSHPPDGPQTLFITLFLLRDCFVGILNHG